MSSATTDGARARDLFAAELDFAALLRVIDQNWYELTRALDLPREARTWVNELQTVRNKYINPPGRLVAAHPRLRGALQQGRAARHAHAAAGRECAAAFERELDYIHEQGQLRKAA